MERLIKSDQGTAKGVSCLRTAPGSGHLLWVFIPFTHPSPTSYESTQKNHSLLSSNPPAMAEQHRALRVPRTGVKLSSRLKAGLVRLTQAWHPELAQVRKAAQGSHAGASCSPELTELVPQQGPGQSLQGDTELAQDTSPAPRRVPQRVLDTLEEHLAQQAHGLEDVLHGVDPACLCAEGQWGTGSRQGTGAWPGCTQNHSCYSLSHAAGHSLARGTAPHPFSSSTISGHCHWHPDGISWENNLQQPPGSEGHLIPPKPSKAVCHTALLPPRAALGSKGDSSLCSRMSSETNSPLQTHEQRPGEQHSCLQSCPAQTSLAAKATFLSWMSRACQALQCSDWDPPCPSQNTKTAPKQPSESSCCSPPTLGALGPCSPLVVLSWAVQGQLGTVTRGPVPPCPAAVVALWEWNRTTSAQG